jgi:hypothetical protein
LIHISCSISSEYGSIDHELGGLSQLDLFV